MRVAVAGATGYSGRELVRILARHPRVEVVAVASRGEAGRPVASYFRSPGLPERFVEPGDLPRAGAEVVFLALPNKEGAALTAELVAAGSRVIDLGADFRFRDRARYEAYYGPHPAPDLLPLSVNGYADDPGFAAGEARILGNPGCYPTAFFLAMGPLVRSGVRPGLVLVDGKSGVSGAGRSLRADLMAAEMDANVVAYSTPGGHRHTAEMEGTWGAPVVFQPHLMPMDRGIELTIYWPGAEADPDRVRREWTAFYAGNPFVAVLPEGVMPSTRRVYGTNAAELAVARDGRNGTLVCYVTIDNLGKGAAGQAVQHLNRWMGWPADLGLRVD